VSGESFHRSDAQKEKENSIGKSVKFKPGSFEQKPGIEEEDEVLGRHLKLTETGSEEGIGIEAMGPEQDAFETNINYFDEMRKRMRKMHEVIIELTDQNARLASELRLSETKVELSEAKVQLKAERNWELDYDNRDQRREIMKLKNKLKNCISMVDDDDDDDAILIQRRTPLEEQQEKEIEELKQNLRDSEKKGWGKGHSTQ
jgi:hypothetical protein